ncbi:MAG: C25 family cysteine peptidase [bacterium]
MLSNILQRVVRLLLSAGVCIAVFGSSALGSTQEPLEHHLGMARFKADYSVVFFPAGISKLYFDTTDCLDCRETLPPWRFIGALKVDSLVRNGVTETVVKQSHMEGLKITSSGLIDCLAEARVYALGRRFSRSVPYDTLVWNRIRRKTVVVPDLSKHFGILFNRNSTVDSVVALLDAVRELTNVGPVPRAIFDSTCGPLCDNPWIPNDTYGAPWWHTKKRDSVGQGGANLECAWSLLADGARGPVIVGISDLGVDPDHYELEGKLHCCGDGSIYAGDPGHGVAVAGIILAHTNNGFGVRGVAPDAEYIDYNFRDDVDTFSRAEDIVSALTDGCDIISMTWHWLITDTALHDVLVQAKASEVPVICSAGNLEPGNPPYVSAPSVWTDLCISVTCHSAYGNVVNSNHGCDTCDPSIPDFVDVAAPGWGIPTLALLNGYGNFFGTSAAAPVVAGIVALARGYNSELPVDHIVSLLKATADRTGLSGTHDEVFGAGRVDAYGFMLDIVNTSMATTRSSDSVPSIIITDDSLTSAFQPLADLKTKRGTKTEIVTVQDIATGYSGEDLQAKVRACIKDYYQNKYLQWVILGGDGTVVPFRFAYNDLSGPGVIFISDYYFACLDGDWNYDSDTLYGEVEDSVDLTPEVAVGRLPFSTTAEVDNYIAKLDAYESSDSADFQTKALFLGSHMFQDGDGQRASEDIISLFPGVFTITELYDGPGGTASLLNYFQAMNAGKAMVVKHGLAGHEREYMLRVQGTHERLLAENVDTLHNFGKPSVVFSATCWNHRLDQDSSIAERYMKHATGGAVAYVGSTYNDFVLRSHVLTREFFGQLFGNGPKEIGDLLNLGKQVADLEPHREGAGRHAVMGYTLSGDPQMRIWTHGPLTPLQYHLDTVVSGSEIEVVDTVKSETWKPVINMPVCLMKEDDVYQVKHTNSYGVVSFTTTFTSGGVATITLAGDEWYKYDIDSITVLPCCQSIRGNVDGDGWDQIDAGDLTYLVAYLFQGGPEPPCYDEGNVDGADVINVGDLTYLTAYLFQSGSAPPACP